MKDISFLEGYALCGEVAWHFATQPAVMATTALALAVVTVVAVGAALEAHADIEGRRAARRFLELAAAAQRRLL